MANEYPPAGEGPALRVVEDLRRRSALDEASGILAVWGRCGHIQARARLRSRHGAEGELAEAVRVAGANDAAANGQADPDWV